MTAQEKDKFIKELRFGAVVEIWCDTPNCNPTQWIWTCITPDLLNRFDQGKVLLRPVYITPEILLRNGFTELESKHLFYRFTDNSSAIHMEHVGEAADEGVEPNGTGDWTDWVCWYGSMNDEAPFYDQVLCYPNYLHLLQNAILVSMSIEWNPK